MIFSKLAASGRRDSIPERCPARVTPRRTFEARWSLIVLGVAAVLVAAAYANALRCEFVYDDKYEIVANPYIQQNQYFVKALTSDVWAFHGDRGRAWSNYWRPLFITWMAANYRLFGLQVIGWHVANIVAHFAVVVLICFVLRALDIRPVVRAVAVWLFAVHPTHVESVTWASGVPNMLMSAFLFAAYLCHLRGRARGGLVWYAPATLLYLCALLSKEGAVAFPAIVFLSEIALASTPRAGAATLRLSIRRAVPYLAIALLFVGVRYRVLETMRILAPGAPGIAGVVATAPLVLTFYLKQMLWPVTLGMAYGVRAVSGANYGFANFWLPLAALVLLGRVVAALWGRAPAYRLGAIWFLCAIALALDIRVFLPEEIVHDRYLYLPLFGGLLFVAEAVGDIARRFAASPRAGRAISLRLGAAAAIAFAVATSLYNRIWANEVTLWQRAAATDPLSANAAGEYGEALRKAGHLVEARAELERALTLNPDARTPHLALGMVALAERSFGEAEERLGRVLEALPDDPVAREQLALCRQLQGRYGEAIRLFDEGRERLPHKRLVYTVNIAVLHKLEDRPRQAIAELEPIRAEMNGSADPAVIQGLYYLAELYLEVDERVSALALYGEYLARTERAVDARTLEIRRLVEETIGRLSGR
ncbi:MAG: hypothetical protein DCC65_06405 [Planctomycetota bacterium]|nr:MAG: hypothetical protein DCC65_06405 [Planctomycetota bacterium]